ncbi:MAG: hypothetical protein JF606_26030, partial [Burkholderiales bacterium]|nr:hypothetical protein [Burkholderiales bacterium]
MTMLRAQTPQIQGETNSAYARRLHSAHQHLTWSELSQLSGVKKSHLKQDPAFRVLPDHLAPIYAQVPQLEGEKNSAYARRLHSACPHLTLPEISQLSGVLERHLKQDPAFWALPAHLAPICEQTPKLDGENKQTYARRLHSAHSQLTLHEISQLSGVKESHLKEDPAFRALPEHLAPIYEQFPQLDRESNSAYARRLHSAHQHLAWSEIALLSGVKESHLKADPAFRALPEHLAPIYEQLPQLDRESNSAYARRLHSAHQHLAWSEISQLSGVKESHLKEDPAFRALPEHLAPIREQLPQLEGESKLAYARRLHSAHPHLIWREISQLSGVLESNLKRNLAFKQAPTLSTGVGPANSALPGSASSRSRGLKRTAIEAAAAQPVPQEALAIRSVRARLTDERGRQHPPNVQAAPAQAAGTHASQLQELLAYQELLRSNQHGLRGLNEVGRELVNSYGADILQRFNQVSFEAKLPLSGVNSSSISPADMRNHMKEVTPALTLANGGLLMASTAFVQPGSSMATIASAAGVSEQAMRLYFTESGLTQEGWNLLAVCNETTKAGVMWNVQLGLQKRTTAERSDAQPAPESHLPADWDSTAPHAEAQSPQSSFGHLPASDWLGWQWDPDAQSRAQSLAASASSQEAGPQYGMAPAHAAHAPSFTPLPDMSGGWPDVGLFPATPSQEVAGPHHPPRQSESYIFGGLAPVASLPSSLHGHTDWGQSAPEVTSAARGWPAGASTSQPPSKPPVQSSGGQRSGRVAAQDAPGGASRPPAGATIRTAIVVEDAETDRPRKRARVGAAQRLGNSGWLSDGDIIDYTKAIAAEIAGKPGAERIGFADPPQIRLLLEGDIKAQAAVRRRLVDNGAPPILFVPVHGSGNHWSLLAIDRHANQAYHYDSMVPPDMAHWATETEQFKQANTVAG